MCMQSSYQVIEYLISTIFTYYTISENDSMSTEPSAKTRKELFNTIGLMPIEQATVNARTSYIVVA